MIQCVHGYSNSKVIFRESNSRVASVWFEISDGISNIEFGRTMHRAQRRKLSLTGKKFKSNDEQEY